MLRLLQEQEIAIGWSRAQMGQDRSQGVVLVASIGQTSADTTPQIVNADEVLAVVLIVRRNREEAPIGGEVWIFVTDFEELTQFLAALVVPHEPRCWIRGGLENEDA